MCQILFHNFSSVACCLTHLVVLWHEWNPSDLIWYVLTFNHLDGSKHANNICTYSNNLIVAYWCYKSWFIYMFAVVNFDALAQSSDFRIERWQVVFLCWMQDSIHIQSGAVIMRCCNITYFPGILLTKHQKFNLDTRKFKTSWSMTWNIMANPVCISCIWRIHFKFSTCHPWQGAKLYGNFFLEIPKFDF